MKKLFFLPLLALLAMSMLHVDTYSVDSANSNVAWVGYKVTGQHAGNVKIKNGSLSVDHGKLVGGSFEIDMNSITCTDMQGEYADKLVGHLKADDFFGTAKFPTAKFVITKAFPTDSKGNHKIVGQLTIKDKTNEVAFNANLDFSGNEVSATGKIVVDRSKFDVKYGSGSFFDGLGDKTIYDDFDLNVTLKAKK